MRVNVGWAVLNVVLCLVLCSQRLVLAQTSAPASVPQSPAQASPTSLPPSSQASKPTLTPTGPAASASAQTPSVPLVAQPLRLADFLIDPEKMGPAPALAERLAHIDAFVQQRPLDGQAPSEATEVYLARTVSSLYLVFLCHDSRPARIRSHLARRENILNDDYVALTIDPFQDHRRGVRFQVNPQGVQADATWTENQSPDYSYDQVWDSEAHITRTGWAALIAIPFRSLRFRPG